MSLKLENDKQLVAQMRRIRAAVVKKAVRKANTKAMRPVVQQAKASVRKESGTVSKAIGVRHKHYSRSGTMVSMVGIRNQDSVIKQRPTINPFSGMSAYRKHDPRKTAHLIERGTKPHQIVVFGRLKISHPGTKPRPFLAPAMERNISSIIAVQRNILRAEIINASLKA
jgi:HK97 gp10 family phage protein